MVETADQQKPGYLQLPEGSHLSVRFIVLHGTAGSCGSSSGLATLVRWRPTSACGNGGGRWRRSSPWSRRGPRGSHDILPRGTESPRARRPQPGGTDGNGSLGGGIKPEEARREAPCRRGIQEYADETRSAVLLGALPQPASRQHDVTGHHGTDLPEHPLGASFRVAERSARNCSRHFKRSGEIRPSKKRWRPRAIPESLVTRQA